MKKYLSCLLLIVVLLSGCLGNPPTEETYEITVGNCDEKYPMETQPLNYLFREEYAFKDSFHYRYSNLQYSADDRLDAPELQQAVSEIAIQYPILSDEQIQMFAWELYDISMSFNLFEPEMIPDAAYYYADGIWYISFKFPVELESSNMYHIYEGALPVFLISAEDGHVIHYEYE